MSNKRNSERAVTGASQGIGAGLVKKFLERGFSVVANARQMTQSNALKRSEKLALVDGELGRSATAANIVEEAIGKLAQLTRSSTTTWKASSKSPNARPQLDSWPSARHGYQPPKAVQQLDRNYAAIRDRRLLCIARSPRGFHVSDPPSSITLFLSRRLSSRTPHNQADDRAEVRRKHCQHHNHTR